MTPVSCDTLIVGGGDAGDDKSLVNIDAATDFVHNFQGHGNSFLNHKVW